MACCRVRVRDRASGSRWGCWWRPTSAAWWRDPGAGSPSAVARRILIVDDVDFNRELALALLADTPHQVDVAESAREAIRLVSCQEYDLVFMDVQMPGMDGLAATRAMRAQTDLAGLPIVALTAQALPAQIAACAAAGMDDYLAKPIAPGALEAMIAKWTGENAKVAITAPLSVPPALLAAFIQRSRDNLKKLPALIADDDTDVRAALSALVHRLAGTAGMFGFPDASAEAGALDALLAQRARLDCDAFEPLTRALSSIVKAA